MKEIRPLRPDEIECRIQQITSKGVMLLLYKDARCDMAILDEVFSPFGWQRHHELINGKEFCTVSIKSDNGEWVQKQDCGVESNTEKAKGESSDAFKRACFNWGIGRELYTKIYIFISVPTVQQIYNGNPALDKKNKPIYEMEDKYAKFTVKSIETDKIAKKILKIEIADKTGKCVFKLDNKNPPICEEEKSKIKQPKTTPKYTCIDCNAEFKPFEYNGKEYSSQQAFELSKTKSADKKPRCADCRKKLEEK